MVRWSLTLDDTIVREDDATNVGDALFAARAALDEIRVPDSKAVAIFGMPKYRLVLSDGETHIELASLTLK